ncbi:hypothetical protein B0H14DRAFT_2595499 [Mycena olivaceomarginata]|nr:hypothetical protein B0H14DRAFT_2595499 [Mycena olivaceomarginata]
MRFFSSSFPVLFRGLFAAASPVPAVDTTRVAIRDTVSNASVIPLTLFTLFQMLKVAIVRVTPTLHVCTIHLKTKILVLSQLPTSSVVPLLNDLTGVLNTATAQPSTNAPGDQGTNNKDLTKLINKILDITIGQGMNSTLNKPISKLGVDGLLTPVDAAVSSLLVSLDALLVPSLLAALQPLLVGLSGVVSGLLAGLDLTGL